jgi:hypothetical protein
MQRTAPFCAVLALPLLTPMCAMNAKKDRPSPVSKHQDVYKGGKLRLEALA